MPYQLIVDGGHLRQGLKWFEKVRKIRATGKALLSFDRSFVVVEGLDRGFVARASGEWPGTAKVGATLLAALAKAPPTSEDVHLVYADGRLRVGSLSVSCVWEPVSAAMTKAPAAPDWIAALLLKYRMPRANIISEGLATKVAEAEREVARLVRKCAKALAPVYVTEGDLRELVERRVSGHAEVVGESVRAASLPVRSARVAWAPDPPNNFGAVMAPPGPITTSQHRLLLATQVQAMVDEYEDPMEVLRDVERELGDHGMVPDLRRHPDWAGGQIVAALEGYLTAIGALAYEDTVPAEDDEAAMDAMDGRTLMDWVGGVLTS